MFYKVKEIQTLENLILKVKFENGKEKYYDIKQLLNKYAIFEQLRKNEVFKKVKIDAGGYGISWNESIDLSCNELWHNGKEKI